MEKIKLGIIGVGAQGGAYAGFLTGRGGMPGMPPAPQPEHMELGALCDIDPRKGEDVQGKIPRISVLQGLEGNGRFRQGGRRRHDGAALSAP